MRAKWRGIPVFGPSTRAATSCIWVDMACLWDDAPGDTPVFLLWWECERLATDPTHTPRWRTVADLRADFPRRSLPPFGLVPKEHVQEGWPTTKAMPELWSRARLADVLAAARLTLD